MKSNYDDVVGGNKKTPTLAHFEMLPNTRINFASWVPTVSGRLSFNVIGSTKHPSKAVFGNVFDAEAEKRAILGYQRRVLHDRLFFRHLPFQKAYWFVFAAHTPTGENVVADERLVGTVYIFDKENWKATRPLADAWVEELRRFDARCGSLESKPKIESVDKALGSQAAFQIDFSLRRDGCVLFQYSEERQKNADRVKFPLRRLNDHGHELNISHPIKVIASQAFFFLKDICHEHQHHHPFTDTVIDLLPMRNWDRETQSYESNPERKRFRWRRDIRHKLQGKIVQYKRTKTPAMLRSSQGVLAYLNAFMTLSTRRAAGLKDVGPDSHFFGDTVYKSITAGLEDLSEEQRRRDHSASTRILAILTLVALIVGTFNVLQLYPGDREYVKDLLAYDAAKFALVNFDALCVIATLTALTSILRPLRRSAVLRGLWEDFKRVPMVLGKIRSFLAYAMVSALSIIGFFKVASSIVETLLTRAT